MYDRALATKILEALNESFPRRLHLHDLQSLPALAGASEEDILIAVDALAQEGKVAGALLRDGAHGGLVEAAGLEITQAGRLEFAKTTEAAPQARTTRNVDLGFMRSDSLRGVVQRDYRELQELSPQVTPKAVLVLSGAVLEGVLLDALVSSGKWALEIAQQQPLSEMIGPAKARGIIKRETPLDAVRRYRTLIHPGREMREDLPCEESDAKLAVSAVDVVLREVRVWYSNQGASFPAEAAPPTAPAHRSFPPTAGSLPLSQHAIDIEITSGHPQSFTLLVTSHADEQFEVTGVIAEFNGASVGKICRPAAGNRWIVAPRGNVTITWPRQQNLGADLVRVVGQYEHQFSDFLDFVLSCLVDDEPRELRKRLRVRVDPRSYWVVQD